MNAVTTTAPPLSFGDLDRLAEAIAKSGLFGMKTRDQALVLMMIAHAEGRHPALAARDYDVIQGKPAKKAEAMMRDFLEAGGKVEWHTVTDALVDATFTHPQTGSVRVDWDMARARVAGLAGKDTWQKFPRQMLRSRVVSEGVRTLWPLATSGLYVPEEAADMKAANDSEHNGPTLEAEAEAEVPPPSRRDQINREVPLKAAAAPMRRGDTVRAPVESNPDEPPAWLAPLEETDPHRWEIALDLVLANCQSRAEVVRVGGHHSVETAIAKAPEGVKMRVSKKLADAFGRFAADPEPADELGEIVGEDKIMSGDD